MVGVLETALSTEAEVGTSLSPEDGLVRALAAHDLILDRDAAADELPERQRALARKLSTPLDGFGRHGSRGAFSITRVAVDLVPAGHGALRSHRLDPDGLRAALVDHGLSPRLARAVVGDWAQAPDHFAPSADGLSLSELAGLAERALTRRERTIALAQVAASPRDLDRLVAAAALVHTVRGVLPLLGSARVGPFFDLAVVGFALARADRVAALTATPADAFERTLHELATAMASLEAAQAPRLEVDAQVLMPPEATGASEDDDDVLSVVEESADHGIDVCRWGGNVATVEHVAAWRQALAGFSAPNDGAGLRPAPVPTTAPPLPMPPDPQVVLQWAQATAAEEPAEGSESAPPPFSWRWDPIDALVPVVRGALRVIVAAAEGEGPSDAAIESAGDLGWVIRRAAALAAVVQGDLPYAVDVTRGVPSEAPESRWAEDRARRFGERQADPAEPEEARPMAAALIGDLAHQLARTIAGTVPPRENA